MLIFNKQVPYYRGMSFDTQEWVFGAYINNSLLVKDGDCFIASDEDCMAMNLVGENWVHKTIKIRRETLGMYSGEYDIEGHPIYSGDILERVSHANGEQPEHFFVICVDFQFFAEGISFVLSHEFSDCRIVGNMIDTPQLFKTLCDEVNKSKGISSEHPESWEHVLRNMECMN